ncbi:MAG: LysR family transcriptional regulator [Comamonadaceae bacterium]|nr:MAG: LysR family transcriptional regulator [Comamonadaceae bacterium]
MTGPGRNLRRLDLNLLVAFDALLAERSVTRAADRLSVGQPAMSASLAKLRKFFGDPLLVRQGRGLVPTTVAEDLAVPIREALERIESAIESRRRFDPRIDRHTFTIMASDYALLLLLSSLLDELAVEAPNVRINIVPHVANYEEMVLRSKVDLLIAPQEVVESSTGLQSHTLLTDRFVCAIDRDHPLVGKSMSAEQFQTLPYVGYHLTLASSIPERQLSARGVARRIEVATQSFVVQPLILRGTRSFALVPLRLVEHLAETAGIRWVETPFDLGAIITETMFWAQRVESDQAHRWLRERVALAADALASISQ